MHPDGGSIKPKRQDGVPAGTDVGTRRAVDNEGGASPSIDDKD